MTTGLHGPLVADKIDKAIFMKRATARDRVPGPRVGDFIDFNDGTSRRITHVWDGEYQSDGVARLQTEWHTGSFYLGDEGMSYSGGLYPGIRANLLRLVGSRNGACWIFHHDYMTAHNGVDDEVACRVYAIDAPGTDPENEDKL